MVTSALTASTMTYQLTLNVRAGVVVALAVSRRIGFFNGWLLVHTGLPGFLVTLGTSVGAAAHPVGDWIFAVGGNKGRAPARSTPSGRCAELRVIGWP